MFLYTTFFKKYITFLIFEDKKYQAILYYNFCFLDHMTFPRGINLFTGRSKANIEKGISILNFDSTNFLSLIRVMAGQLFNFIQLNSVYIQSFPWRLLLHPAAWNTVSELCINFCNLQREHIYVLSGYLRCIKINGIFLHLSGL